MIIGSAFDLGLKMNLTKAIALDLKTNKAYLNTFNSEIIENIDSELWILGYQVQFMSDEMPDKMRKFRSIDDVIYALNVV